MFFYYIEDHMQNFTLFGKNNFGKKIHPNGFALTPSITEVKSFTFWIPESLQFARDVHKMLHI